MLQALLVEDDPKLGSYVEKGLRQHGYHVEWVRDGTAGYRRLRDHDFTVAVIDLMLPGLDGISLIQRLREEGRQTPILILSAKSDVGDRVSGLNAGADDYLTKPFSFAELIARLDALQRRHVQASAAPITSLEYAGLKVDLLRRRVVRDGDDIELQPKEFALLEYLLRNRERVLSKTMILEHVWEYAFDPQTNVVDVLVSRLRRKIDRERDDKLIHTIRGVGYVLRRQ